MLRRLLLPLLLVAACTKHPVDPDEGGVDAGDEEPATTTSAVKIFVEPSDNAQALVTSLQNAQSSIHMTMYLLTNNTVISTLVAKKKAGLEVKVVLNQTFPAGSGSDNSSVFNQLQSGGVEVVWAPSVFTYTHEKAVVIDGTSAWIMTMNVTFSSPTANREYLALDTDPDDIAETEQIFQADFANTGATFTGKLLVAPVNAHQGLLDLINDAQTKLDVEDEELSDAQIVTALVAAHDRGVAVRVVLSDDTPTTAMSNAVTTLEADGIGVKKLSDPYVHAKAIVADDVLCYVGSENMTANSLDSNRELGLIISAVSEIAKVDATIVADFGAGVVY
ncbi:MAG TPA: phospholipase D-like domain-containing protein [Polyangiaceae bacterium]|jgi:phosphatidylserine/phosphatidylglycerophosphate/cardiolipin synthase-like enzyme|nr:phospholipase D-like domain-containing protein [Polyangiaceae bacterium]